MGKSEARKAAEATTKKTGKVGHHVDSWDVQSIKVGKLRSIRESLAELRSKK